MNKTSLSQLTLGLLLALAPGPALGGAWTPPAGSAYQKLAVNFLYSDSSFSHEQDEASGFRSFTNTNLTYYAEYGVFDALTLITSIPVTVLTRRDDGGNTETAGLADVDLGVRYRLLEAPVVLSTQFLFKLPYFYDQNDSLPLGNGQEDFEGRFLLGRSLGRLGYFGVESGYRYRRQAPSDEFRYLVEYGVDATDSIYFRTKLDGVKAIGNGAPGSAGPGNPALQNEFDLGRLEVTGGFEFTETWIGELSFTSNLYGRNTLRGEGFQLALIYSF